MNAALVLGVGNSLLGDDGVGVHVVRFLVDNPPCAVNCKIVDGGTLSFTLASEVEETDALIVIDAANLGEAPGSVRVFVGDAMDDFVANRRSRSVHEVCLLDLLTVLALNGDLPSKRALIGVQPTHIGWEHNLSPAVQASVVVVAAKVDDLLMRWGCADLTTEPFRQGCGELA